MAKTVTPAPGYVMLRELLCEFGIIDIQSIVIPAYATGLLGIPVRNAKPAAFIVDKAIKRDTAFRAEVPGNLYGLFKWLNHFQAMACVSVIGNAVNSLMVSVVLIITPVDSLVV